MAADGDVAEGRADRRRLQGQGIRTISANVSGLRWCVFVDSGGPRPPTRAKTGKAPAVEEPGPPASLWAKKVFLSGTHPNKSHWCPRSSNSRGQTALRGPDEKIPKKSGTGPNGSFKLIYKDKNREVDWDKPENDPK